MSASLFPLVFAQEIATTAAPKEALAGLNKALGEAKEGSSQARHRLAVRRVIRDAEELLASVGNSPDRFPVLEFLFRARQQLIAIDDEAEHRKALLETCRELVKAPDEMAALRLEADLLLSQAELARQGANAEERAQALRPLVARYLGTPVGAKVLRMAMVMALELGDSRVVTDLQKMMEENFAADLDIINFQRDKLGGQVFGAPFCGSFERSDGKMVRFPMDGLGRMTLCVFWSKEGDGLKFLEGLATGAKENKDRMTGRLEIFSFNLDNLPDAGESILRGQGVDWQALRLPGGRENPIYKAYARNDPRMLSVSPTGYAALFLSGTTRDKVDPTADTDFARSLGSILSRNWADERYTMQITSLMAGDFLVIDPEGGIHPALPPELKATAKEGAATPLAPGTAEVPEETLRTIQACFVAPPQRYRLTHPEALANYGKATELCRKAIADHPSATNLWIVRNRLIIALMGLWKTNSDPRSLEAAIVEAKAALAAGYPRGCDVIARFCIARGALRDPAAEPRKTLDGFMADCGGENAPGPAYAAASLLALEVADRQGFERFRKEIFAKHTENPMMWTYTAFLLDRHHRYWLFQFPFSAGWSYGHRENYAKSVGIPEESHRILKTELQTLDGKPLRIPQDLDSEWTLIVFARPGPWSSKRDDNLPPSPLSVITGATTFAAARPAGDMKVILATLGGEPDAIRASLEALVDAKRKQAGVECPVAIVPNGTANPLVQRLGILSEDQTFNSVLLRKDGRIALAMSGYMGGSNPTYVEIPANIIRREDEEFVTAALKRGDVEAAKQRVFALAPPFNPETVDEKGKKVKPPVHGLAHLRARARVYMALKEWDKALADAEEVVARQLDKDGGMSLRTDELDESEALRDEILRQTNPAK